MNYLRQIQFNESLLNIMFYYLPVSQSFISFFKGLRIALNHTFLRSKYIKFAVICFSQTFSLIKKSLIRPILHKIDCNCINFILIESSQLSILLCQDDNMEVSLYFSWVVLLLLWQAINFLIFRKDTSILLLIKNKYQPNLGYVQVILGLFLFVLFVGNLREEKNVCLSVSSLLYQCSVPDFLSFPPSKKMFGLWTKHEHKIFFLP